MMAPDSIFAEGQGINIPLTFWKGYIRLESALNIQVSALRKRGPTVGISARAGAPALSPSRPRPSTVTVQDKIDFHQCLSGI